MRTTVQRWRDAGYVVMTNGRVDVARSEKLLRGRPATDKGAALRQLRQALERSPYHARLYIESLAKRPSIAVATIERGDDGVIVTLKPARYLAMFLTRAQR